MLSLGVLMPQNTTMDIWSEEWTEKQLNILTTTTRVASILGMLGSLSIVTLFCLTPKNRRQIHHHILLFMSISEVCGSVGTVMAMSAYGNHYVCDVQGWLIQFALSGVMWNVCLATDMLLRLFFTWKEDESRRLLKYYHVFAWGFPLISASLLVHWGAFGPAGTWCWIHYDFVVFRFAFYYIIVWVAWAYILVVVIILIRHIMHVWNAVGHHVDSHKAYVIVQVASYSIAFLLSWAPGTPNRIHNILRPNGPIFGLVFMHCLLFPLQGFINFFVYTAPGLYRKWHKGRTINLANNGATKASIDDASKNTETVSAHQRSSLVTPSCHIILHENLKKPSGRSGHSTADEIYADIISDEIDDGRDSGQSYRKNSTNGSEESAHSGLV